MKNFKIYEITKEITKKTKLALITAATVGLCITGCENKATEVKSLRVEVEKSNEENGKVKNINTDNDYEKDENKEKENNNIINNQLRLTQEREKRIKFINYYSKVYNLDEFWVLKNIEITTNLLSEEALKKNIDHNDLELAILNKVQNINKLSFGIMKKNNYKKTKTYREMVNHYANLYGIDANIALAIECIYTNFYKSLMVSKKHNPGALRLRSRNIEYTSFENVEQGIIAHMKALLPYKNKSIQAIRGECTGRRQYPKGLIAIYNILERDPNYFTLPDEKASQKKKSKIK